MSSDCIPFYLDVLHDSPHDDNGEIMQLSADTKSRVLAEEEKGLTIDEKNSYAYFSPNLASKCCYTYTMHAC